MQICHSFRALIVKQSDTKCNKQPTLQGNEKSVLALISALKQCGKKGDLERAKTLHSHALCHANEYVYTALIAMYSKCGSMHHAHAVFNNVTRKCVVSWNSLIFGYVNNGESLVALDVFQLVDCQPNCLTFVAALKACTSLATGKQVEKHVCLEKGMAVHRLAREYRYEHYMFLANTLVDMYVKCGSLFYARVAFDGISHPDAVSFTALVLGYVENGQAFAATELLRSVSCEPDPVTFVAALKACGDLETGMAIHKQAKDIGFHTGLFVASKLMDMYSKCGSMSDSRSLFDSMPRRDVVLWNTLLHGYVENGESSVSLELFTSMDCKPDPATFVAVLKACSSDLVTGMAIHKQARELGLDTDAFVENTLVDFYSKSKCMDLARAVFDKVKSVNIVSWNSLMLGYVENGESLVALDLFASMDCEANSVTFVAVLKACVTEKSLEKIMSVHRQALRFGFERDIMLANTLVDVYGKCRSMQHAQVVFENVMETNVISWNNLILGYVENGESLVAMDLIINKDCEPDLIQFAAALKACGVVGGLKFGNGIHSRICKAALGENQMVATCLVDMYAKCGNMVAAEHVFSMMHLRDTVTWNALITGYASLGDTSRVVNLVTCMQEAGIQMDGITFILLLTACSHGGMIEEGKKYFQLMAKHGIRVTSDHYACIVDMLSRANRQEEALSIVKSMPFEPDTVVCTALQGPWRDQNNMNRIP